MEQDNFNQEEFSVEQKSSMNQVTPLSKYLALALFIVLPFIGGYIGYTLAPEKVVEIEKAVTKEVVVEKETQEQTTQKSEVTTSLKKVESVGWTIEAANPGITNPDDYKQYEQAISIDVTFTDNTTQTYELGNAYGCTDSSAEARLDDKNVLGKVTCYFSLTGVDFVAYAKDDGLVVEKHADDASGRTSGTKEVLLNL